MDNDDFNRTLQQILRLTEHTLAEFKQTASNSTERIFCSGKLAALEVFAEIDRQRLWSNT